MKKIVFTQTGNAVTATVQEATIAEVLNPTIPLADANSNLIRVGAYVFGALLLARL